MFDLLGGRFPCPGDPRWLCAQGHLATSLDLHRSNARSPPTLTDASDHSTTRPVAAKPRSSSRSKGGRRSPHWSVASVILERRRGESLSPTYGQEMPTSEGEQYGRRGGSVARGRGHARGFQDRDISRGRASGGPNPGNTSVAALPLGPP